MYTLVSASVLALDLARHPSGAAVADVVDRALALDPAVAGAARPAVVDLGRARARGRLLDAADRAPRLEQALRAVSRSVGTPDGAAAASVLRRALVGRLDDLVELLERELGEVRALPRGVVDVVTDRLVAAWLQDDDSVAAADRVRLSADWAPLVGDVPPSPPAQGAVPELLALLEQVARTGRDAWCALDDEHARAHVGLSWSELLHAASRAAVEHGRVVPVARWQLSAVRATSAAGHVAGTCTPGAVMSLVGAVQALALLDVLPATVSEPLLAPCRRVLGTG